MADASNAGVLSSDAPILTQQVGPQANLNSFPVKRAPALLVPVLAFALSNWILSGMAQARTYDAPRQQAKRDRIIAETSRYNSETTATSSDATSQSVKVFLASLDSDNG